MRFSTVAAVAAAVAGVSAWENGTVVYTTEVVTEYTTYCPAATTIAHGNKTYTVTAPTTLTITNCPCTITRPVYTSSIVICNTCTTAPTPITTPVYQNSTSKATQKPTSTVAATVVAPSSTPIQTGAANKAFIASGASLAGLLGLAAYLL